ncbi:MAG: lysylphosphatidylglycerol synthase transmembrane domain-containing protein [Bacteroidota bacterium]
MSTNFKKALRIIVPFTLGFLLLAFIYNSTTPADRNEIINNISNASPFWVGVSVIIGILSHVSRAIRWNYLLLPMGYSPKISNNFFMVMIAYLANLGVPRSGEFLRATALAGYEDVPFEKGFGTIITERVIDVIMLLAIIIGALLLQTNFVLRYLKDYGFNLGFSIAILAIGIIGILIFLRLIGKANDGFLLKIKTFFDGMLQGIASILKMKKKWPFILHTLFIWTCYVGMFWAIKFSVPETIELGWSGLLVAFVAGAFAMMVFPGGLGGYPVFVSAALSLYGISDNSGDAFGWILWIAQTLMIIFLGAISFVLLPLLNRNR